MTPDSLTTKALSHKGLQVLKERSSWSPPCFDALCLGAFVVKTFSGPDVQKTRVVVAVRPEASVTVRVIVPRSNSLIVNEVVGDAVMRSGFAEVQPKSHV